MSCKNSNLEMWVCLSLGWLIRTYTTMPVPYPVACVPDSSMEEHRDRMHQTLCILRSSSLLFLVSFASPAYPTLLKSYIWILVSGSVLSRRLPFIFPFLSGMLVSSCGHWTVDNCKSQTFIYLFILSQIVLPAETDTQVLALESLYNVTPLPLSVP